MNSIKTFWIPLEKTNIKKTKKNSKKGSLKIKIGTMRSRYKRREREDSKKLFSIIKKLAGK